MSGIQSPVVPSGATGRSRRGPKAEVPKSLIGLRVARRVWGFWSTRLPAETLSVVRRLSSEFEISILPVRGNDATDLREKVSSSSEGRSSSPARWMGVGVAWPMFLLMSARR